MSDSKNSTSESGHWIPPATQIALDQPAPVGDRHNHILKIVVALTAQNHPPEDIYDMVRPGYPSDGPHPVSDREIWDMITGAQNYSLTAYGPTTKQQSFRRQPKVAAKAPPERKVSPTEAIAELVGDYTCTKSELMEMSPVQIPMDSTEQMICALEALYDPADKINIVGNCHKETESKAVPIGYGKTHPQSTWVRGRRVYVPKDQGGAWIRMNPTNGEGISDKDIVDYRYALVEFDDVPMDTQLAFFAKINLPIAMLVHSGGKSVHAWILINAPDIHKYREMVAKVYALLAKFGIDTANKNPGRLSRLPGAVREIGAVGGGKQELLYLNPTPKWEAIHG